MFGNIDYSQVVMTKQLLEIVTLYIKVKFVELRGL